MQTPPKHFHTVPYSVETWLATSARKEPKTGRPRAFWRYSECPLQCCLTERRGALRECQPTRKPLKNSRSASLRKHGSAFLYCSIQGCSEQKRKGGRGRRQDASLRGNFSSVRIWWDELICLALMESYGPIVLCVNQNRAGWLNGENH